MLSFLLKYRQSCLLTLCALLGLACSHLAAVLLGSQGRSRPAAPVAAPVQPAPAAAPEVALGFILQHHLFDRTARTAASVPFSVQTGAAGEPAVAPSDLELVGTVVAGSRSLAMIRTAQQIQIHHLDAELAGGKVEEITRHEVIIRNRNGSQTVLRLREDKAGAGATGTGSARTARTAGTAPGAPAGGGSAPTRAADGSEAAPAAAGPLRPAGDNQWIVPRSTAEAARENIGEQLRTAQLQPNLVDGKTDGFTISRIQPGSLLAQMGLRPGDVIKRVNRMPLESPEKALQIMQQLREARQITIDLERGGAPMSFSYTIE